MRLHNLFESKNNTLVLEFGNSQLNTTVVSLNENLVTLAVDESQQQNLEEAREIINELLPLAIGAIGAGISAYDAYQSYKDYKAGNISQADLARRVGSNVALNLIGGGAAKIGQALARGARAGVQAVKRRISPTARPNTPDSRQPSTVQPNTAQANRNSRRRRRPDLDVGVPQASPDTDLTGTIRRIAKFENIDYIVTFPLTESVNLDLTESRSRTWTLKVW